MFNQYKINTKKKRFAFEVIILFFSIFICSIIFFIGYYSENSFNEKKQILETKIDSLSNNSFRVRYNSLKDNQRINYYSYESYKKKILNDKDSSFRIEIYYKLCELYSGYRNERTLDEFFDGFEYESINQIDKQISELKLQDEIITKKLFNSRHTYSTLIIIFLIVIYPIRLIYYLFKWSLTTLSGAGL